MDLADRVEPVAAGLDGLAAAAPAWATAFDDAAAELRLAPPRLCWASPAWQRRCAAWPAHTLAAAVQGAMADDAAMPGGCLLPAADGHGSLALQWRPVPAAPGHVWLRAGPAPGDATQARALQRHLEDRERLLFTSRSISIGEMASTLAHEINQPIGTIANVLRGLAARLARLGCGGVGDARIADLQQGVKLALDQALFAGRVIGRIRDYTASRQPRRETLDLAALLRDSAALLDWEFARHGVAVSVQADGPAWVAGDAVMLQQVVVNLLRNALDAQRAAAQPAAAPPAAVALRLGRSGDGFEVEIVDRGCGISRDAEDRLFVPFVSSKPDGMGLGLKICRSFVELHQGRLWFTRNPAADGGGCTFHIALQAALPSETGGGAAART